MREKILTSSSAVFEDLPTPWGVFQKRVLGEIPISQKSLLIFRETILGWYSLNFDSIDFFLILITTHWGRGIKISTVPKRWTQLIRYSRECGIKLRNLPSDAVAPYILSSFIDSRYL